MAENARIWKILEDSNKYRSFETVDQSTGLELLYMLGGGKRRMETWEPIEVTLYEDRKGKERKKPIGDVMGWLRPMMNENAKQILAPLIGKTVEFLPMIYDIGNFFVLNVDWIECVDIAASVVVIGERSKAIIDIKEFAFQKDQLDNIHMFHVPELKGSSLFVSDIFKRVVEINKLQGLIFYPVKEVDTN